MSTTTSNLTAEQVIAANDELVAAYVAADTDKYFSCFAPDATLTLYLEEDRVDDRDAFRKLWHSWLDSGWRVESCVSTDRFVQIYGNTAVLSHTIDTTSTVDGQQSNSRERETVVFTLDHGQVPPRLLVVHEHLSPMGESKAP